VSQAWYTWLFIFFLWWSLPQGLHEKGPITLGKLKIFTWNRSSCIKYPPATFFFATEPFQLKKMLLELHTNRKIHSREGSSSLDGLECTVLIMGIFLLFLIPIHWLLGGVLEVCVLMSHAGCSILVSGPFFFFSSSSTSSFFWGVEEGVGICSGSVLH